MKEHDFFEYYDMETGYRYTAQQANAMYHRGYDIAVMRRDGVSGEYRVIATWEPLKQE